MIRPAVIAIVLALVTASAHAAERQTLKPIVAGELTFNPHDVIAVYRPMDQRTVTVLVGRPGRNAQVILFKDSREASAIFEAVWNNSDVTKDPGDADDRPLTRMRLKDAQGRPATLIANADRILAIARDNNRRIIRIYVDGGAPSPVPGPHAPAPSAGADAGSATLDISYNREEADTILSAYQASLLSR